MSSTSDHVEGDEDRRPGITKIIKELRERFPLASPDSIRDMAKMQWHQEKRHG